MLIFMLMFREKFFIFKKYRLEHKFLEVFQSKYKNMLKNEI